jgi:hypothetical protein
MANILKDVGIGTVSGCEPIMGGSLNLSYKIRVEDHVDAKHVVKIRSHGYIESTAPL